MEEHKKTSLEELSKDELVGGIRSVIKDTLSLYADHLNQITQLANATHLKKEARDILMHGSLNSRDAYRKVLDLIREAGFYYLQTESTADVPQKELSRGTIAAYSKSISKKNQPYIPRDEHSIMPHQMYDTVKRGGMKTCR